MFEHLPRRGPPDSGVTSSRWQQPTDLAGPRGTPYPRWNRRSRAHGQRWNAQPVGGSSGDAAMPGSRNACELRAKARSRSRAACTGEATRRNLLNRADFDHRRRTSRQWMTNWAIKPMSWPTRITAAPTELHSVERVITGAGHHVESIVGSSAMMTCGRKQMPWRCHALLHPTAQFVWVMFATDCGVDPSSVRRCASPRLAAMRASCARIVCQLMLDAHDGLSEFMAPCGTKRFWQTVSRISSSDKAADCCRKQNLAT